MMDKNKSSMNILKERSTTGVESDLAFIESLE